ncbi:hypothetical protein IFM47457_01199 [Aspergillus lentulus]|nr:hypothetical protein IFM47457_01199 [Aspergillus lentulus]
MPSETLLKTAWTPEPAPQTYIISSQQQQSQRTEHNPNPQQARGLPPTRRPPSTPRRISTYTALKSKYRYLTPTHHHD